MTTNNKQWYTIDNIETIDTPSLVIYPERVKRNIALAIKMVGDVARLRPHVKTHKSAGVTRLMMEAGITKFKCATIAEAEMLGQCGAADVLLAYQPFGPKLTRFVALVKTYPATKYSCLIDNVASATAIAAEAIKNDINIPAFIDLNAGMNRTGILPANAVDLYQLCTQLKGLTIIGLHAYDGHITDADLAVRTSLSDQVFENVFNLQQQLSNSGGRQLIIIMGGSPTFPIHATRSNIECSPGTFVYWDKGYADLYPELKFIPAALVITRVISVLNKETLCLDLGHKSIAAENIIERRVSFINEPDINFKSQSEEHLVIQIPGGTNRKVGEVLYGIPFHICPTVALYDYGVIIENGLATGEWKNVARDRKITI